MIDIERYPIVVEGGPPSNYSAFCPDLPGCVATGSTVDRCISEMRGAIAAHIDLMREHSEPIPEPTGTGVDVKLAAAA